MLNWVNLGEMMDKSCRANGFQGRAAIQQLFVKMGPAFLDSCKWARRVRGRMNLLWCEFSHWKNVFGFMNRLFDIFLQLFLGSYLTEAIKNR